MRFKLDSLSIQGSWNFDGVCDACGENISECKCGAGQILAPNKHLLYFRLEKRNGKPVTIILPFFITQDDMKKTLAMLKKKLACGGSIKDNEIELQGDLKDRAKIILEKDGFRFKK
jgi:translation initiation factor 1